jgi:hypothetical protein
MDVMGCMGGLFARSFSWGHVNDRLVVFFQWSILPEVRQRACGLTFGNRRLVNTKAFESLVNALRQRLAAAGFSACLSAFFGDLANKPSAFVSFFAVKPKAWGQFCFERFHGLAVFSNTRFIAQLVDQLIGNDGASCRKRLNTCQRMHWIGGWLRVFGHFDAVVPARGAVMRATLGLVMSGHLGLFEFFDVGVAK